MAEPLPLLLADLARRAEDRPELLAGLLAAFARSEDMDDAALAAHLGCPPDQLPRLRLCRAPRDEPAGMLQDVGRIASHLGVREEALREAVLRGRVIVRLRRAGDGVLMAARDREKAP
jgi:hypothetical protein